MAQLELVAELVVDEPISTPGSAEPAAANNTPTAPAPAASRKKRGRPPADPNAQASFFCEEAGCGASYVTYGGLYQHKRKHHPWLMSDAKPVAPNSGKRPRGRPREEDRIPDELEWECPVCDKAYASYGGLYQHKRTHHPELANKPALCPPPADKPPQLLTSPPVVQGAWSTAAAAQSPLVTVTAATTESLPEPQPASQLPIQVATQSEAAQAAEAAWMAARAAQAVVPGEAQACDSPGVGTPPLSPQPDQAAPEAPLDSAEAAARAVLGHEEGAVLVLEAGASVSEAGPSVSEAALAE
mmetsp:Transcript_24171/g.78708  ORF Transcript_24171/g.78708 Transcript_24171/m.78708 type:complete len:299 (-) Transcript_24171:151-1047(-)